MEFWGLDIAQWNQVAISVAIVVAALVLGPWLVRRLLFPLLRRLTGLRKSSLDNVFLDSLQGSAYWLLLVVMFQYALERVDFITWVGGLPFDDIFFVIYLTIAFLTTWRLVSSLFNWYIETQSTRSDTRLDQQLLPFISRVTLIIITLIVGIILLGHFNVEVSGLVATLGIGSLAIALAAQEALSDTISGFLIMIDRPFRIGDRIEIQELGTWGDVIDIGLRSSRIRTLDNRMVIVPNSVIGKGLIVNYSYPDSTYRLETEIGVAYGTDVEKAREVLIKAVEKLGGVDPGHEVEALLVNLGDSALVFRVRWWLDSYVDARRMFDRVHTSVVKALTAANIEIPFPQMDVHARLSADQQAALDRLSKPQ